MTGNENVPLFTISGTFLRGKGAGVGLEGPESASQPPNQPRTQDVVVEGIWPGCGTGEKGSTGFPLADLAVELGVGVGASAWRGGGGGGGVEPGRRRGRGLAGGPGGVGVGAWAGGKPKPGDAYRAPRL
jgi:hypothetical protein